MLLDVLGVILRYQCQTVHFRTQDIHYDNPPPIAYLIEPKKVDPLQPFTELKLAVGALTILFSLGTQPRDSLAQRVTFPSETIG